MMGKSGSWIIGRRVDEKRPTRAVEELHQVAATRTERRQHVQVSFPNQISGPECVSVKDQRSLSSTSRKHLGANWAFILKRIGETCRLRLCDARTPSAELGNHWSESWPTEEVVARAKLNFNRPNPAFSLNYFGVAIPAASSFGTPSTGRPILASFI